MLHLYVCVPDEMFNKWKYTCTPSKMAEMRITASNNDHHILRFHIYSNLYYIYPNFAEMYSLMAHTLIYA